MMQRFSNFSIPIKVVKVEKVWITDESTQAQLNSSNSKLETAVSRNDREPQLLGYICFGIVLAAMIIIVVV